MKTLGHPVARSESPLLKKEMNSVSSLKKEGTMIDVRGTPVIKEKAADHNKGSERDGSEETGKPLYDSSF
ncbi:hypothetical protein NDU88_004944 [Pleurodeles waltl]|uniref:Uncharacterized protein n=1 Tax=Pleurodeles waltl TaxID=8319 RepID=A0AAV7SKD9_PLEWA|nr:hypothetical protein NDU88_004944 [Pleurodeles waltl]